MAALGVALIVLWVCWQLGRKSVDDLLDAAPKELHEKVAAAARVEGVAQVRQVRVRRSGPSVFADVAIAVGHDAPLERAHEIADRAEAAVRAALPGADVVVHVEPCAEDDGPLTMARVLAPATAWGRTASASARKKAASPWSSTSRCARTSPSTRRTQLASRFEAELRARVPRLAPWSHISSRRRVPPRAAPTRKASAASGIAWTSFAAGKVTPSSPTSSK